MNNGKSQYTIIMIKNVYTKIFPKLFSFIIAPAPFSSLLLIAIKSNEEKGAGAMMKEKSLGNILVYTFLIIMMVYWLFPLFIALLNSFKTNGELLTNVMSFPKKLQFENYIRTFEKMNYLRSLFNTVVLASIGVS